MRLTLRTLLAWLDDTLSPVEARDIGHQVAESTYAQDLVERIHRVIRQPRLPVPNETGSANDPNTVASYLDNELSPEQITEFEGLCLKSDVHLADVASVHAILSLIGQKAQVPADSRRRMNALEKGRTAAAASRVPSRAPTAPESTPLTEPIVAWSMPEPARGAGIGWVKPFAAVAALLALLAWSIWMSLGSDPSASGRPRSRELAGSVDKTAGPGPLGAIGPKAPVPEPKAKESTKPATPEPTKAAPSPAIAENKAKTEDAGTPRVAAKEELRGPNLPVGAVGEFIKPDVVLLRQNPTSQEWERLPAPALLRPNDRLVNLNPFRTPIQLGAARVQLVKDVEARVLAAGPDQAPRLELVRGRVVIGGQESPAPIAISHGGAILKITPPSSVPVGLEARPANAGLLLLLPQGRADVAVGDATETISGPGVFQLQPPSPKLVKTEGQSAPSWVVDDAPPALDRTLGEQFAAKFQPDLRVVASLVTAMDDKDNKDVRGLAISALGSIGQVEIVLPVLDQPDDRYSRRAAIAVLRSYLSRGPEASATLLKALQDQGGEEWAPVVMTLLKGYTTEGAQDERVYGELVQLLDSTDVAIRELAIDNLMTLSGRDDLGYDPDRPTAGPGLRAWQELLRKKELPLRKAAVPKARETPAKGAPVTKARTPR